MSDEHPTTQITRRFRGVDRFFSRFLRELARDIFHPPSPPPIFRGPFLFRVFGCVLTNRTSVPTTMSYEHHVTGVVRRFRGVDQFFSRFLRELAHNIFENGWALSRADGHVLVAHLNSPDPEVASSLFISGLGGSLRGLVCRVGAPQRFHLENGVTVILPVEICRSSTLCWKFPAGVPSVVTGADVAQLAASDVLATVYVAAVVQLVV